MTDFDSPLAMSVKVKFVPTATPGPATLHTWTCPGVAGGGHGVSALTRKSSSWPPFPVLGSPRWARAPCAETLICVKCFPFPL